MKTILNISALAFLFIVTSNQCFADLLLSTIRSPKQCPEGLLIESRLTNGMIHFDIDVDADEIAHAGGLYKGQVRAKGFLNITISEQPVAFVPLNAVTEGKRTRFQFRISPSATKTSELQLGVSLYEKNGTPTFGGGHSLRIYLAGFEPTMEEKTKPK